MAEPILLKPVLRDPREVLFHRLESAPQDHAEALLAAYDVLQGLHDKGLLELAKGALGSGEKVLQILVDAGNTPEAIRAIRNLMILAKLLDAIDPKVLEGLEHAVSHGLDEAKKSKPPGLWQTLKKLCSSDSRRVLGMGASILQAVGKSVGPEKPD